MLPHLTVIPSPHRGQLSLSELWLLSVFTASGPTWWQCSGKHWWSTESHKTTLFIAYEWALPSIKSSSTGPFVCCGEIEESKRAGGVRRRRWKQRRRELGGLRESCKQTNSLCVGRYYFSYLGGHSYPQQALNCEHDWHPLLALDFLQTTL